MLSFFDAYAQRVVDLLPSACQQLLQAPGIASRRKAEVRYVDIEAF